jgi:signal transduction histidine kinase
MDAKATSLYTAILITSVILGIIIIYFVVSIIRQQRRNLQLHRKNILSEITAMEKERSRIAADLHDELGPLLSAVKMKINSFELNDAEDKVQIDKTNEHIDNMLQRMREISFDLMPSTLLRKGLIIAIKEFVDYVNKDGKLHIELTTQEHYALQEQSSVHLYRIIQEVIHNTLKHSKASELSISISSSRNNLIIKTKDNGIGFDKEELKHNSGFGLRNLVSRTDIMGGVLYLETHKNQGTAYTFEIPIAS